MATLTNTTTAEFGCKVLLAIHDKLAYSEMDDRKALIRAIALLKGAPGNVALVREAEQFMRQRIVDDTTRGTIANRLHPRLLQALQESVRGT